MSWLPPLFPSRKDDLLKLYVRTFDPLFDPAGSSAAKKFREYVARIMAAVVEADSAEEAMQVLSDHGWRPSSRGSLLEDAVAAREMWDFEHGRREDGPKPDLSRVKGTLEPCALCGNTPVLTPPVARGRTVICLRCGITVADTDDLKCEQTWNALMDGPPV